MVPLQLAPIIPLEQQQVIQHLLLSLCGCLRRVQDQFTHLFQVIDTLVLLQPYQWGNEIHPNSEGFRLITERIYREGLKPLILRHNSTGTMN
jgi:hypothetical protein